MSGHAKANAAVPVTCAEELTFERVERRTQAMRVPKQLAGSPGLVLVDATWGVIQPVTLSPGVRTIGELELIEHIRAGGRLVDCRLAAYLKAGTIPGAVNVPHDEILSRIGELDPAGATVIFCNGPQCPASAQAINALLRAGWPPDRLLYYRGGIHDWVTLGLPLAADAAHTADPKLAA